MTTLKSAFIEPSYTDIVAAHGVQFGIYLDAMVDYASATDPKKCVEAAQAMSASREQCVVIRKAMKGDKSEYFAYLQEQVAEAEKPQNDVAERNLGGFTDEQWAKVEARDTASAAVRNAQSNSNHASADAAKATVVALDAHAAYDAAVAAAVNATADMGINERLIAAERVFELAHADYWAKVDVLEHGFLTEAQRTLADSAFDLSKDALRMACDVLDDLEALQALKFGNEVDHEAVIERSNEAIKPVTSSGGGLNFDEIRRVAEENVRLANKDYWHHVVAVGNAVGDETLAEARKGLVQSAKSARVADEALMSSHSAEQAYRTAITQLMVGDEPSADKMAKESGAHLNMVADRLDRYGIEAPRSRFFQSALNAIVKADILVGRLEDSAVRRAESFKSEMSSMADKVYTFGRAVAKTTEIATSVAIVGGISVAKAAGTMFARFKSGVSSAVIGFGIAYNKALDKLGEVILDGAHKAEDASARATAGVGKVIDRAGGLAADGMKKVNDSVTRAANKGSSVVDAVSLHAEVAGAAGSKAVSMVAGLGGGLMGSISRQASKLSDGYSDLKQEVEVARIKRRANP